MGKMFKKPKPQATPVPAAAPAPAVEAGVMQENDDATKKRKKKGKASLLVDTSSNISNTGVNL